MCLHSILTAHSGSLYFECQHICVNMYALRQVTPPCLSDTPLTNPTLPELSEAFCNTLSILHSASPELECSIVDLLERSWSSNPKKRKKEKKKKTLYYKFIQSLLGGICLQSPTKGFMSLLRLPYLCSRRLKVLTFYASVPATAAAGGVMFSSYLSACPTLVNTISQETRCGIVSQFVRHACLGRRDELIRIWCSKVKVSVTVQNILLNITWKLANVGLGCWQTT